MNKGKLTKKEKQELYAHTSKFFVDIAKLVFAGVILAGILKEDVNTLWLLTCGTLVVILSLVMAYNTFKLSKK